MADYNAASGEKNLDTKPPTYNVRPMIVVNTSNKCYDSMIDRK